MKVLIDINEKDYQSLKDGHIPFNVLNAIMSGIKIPNCICTKDFIIGILDGKVFEKLKKSIKN